MSGNTSSNIIPERLNTDMNNIYRSWEREHMEWKRELDESQKSFEMAMYKFHMRDKIQRILKLI